MKKLLLLASLLLASVGANAVETKDLGYVSVGKNQAWFNDGYKSGQDETEMGVGVKLPAAMVSNYVGCKVIGFRIGWGNADMPGELNIFLREGHFNAPDVVTQKATVYNDSKSMKYVDNWNEIKLDNPYVIPENPADLCMGFYVSFPANTVSFSMSGQSARPENSIFFSFSDELEEDGVTRKWFDAHYQYPPVLMVAIVEIPDGKGSVIAAEITMIQSPGIQRIGELRTAYTTIRNHGTEDITSVKLHYSIGDQSYDHVQQLGGGIAANEQKAVYLPTVALATGNTKIEISEINGKPNTYKQDITYPMLAVPVSVAAKYKSRPVAELFMSETLHYSPYYMDSLFMPTYQKHAHEVSMICHHPKDQFMTGEDEDSQLGGLFCNFSDKGSYPSVVFNRSAMPTYPTPNTESILYNILYPMYAESPYTEILGRPTFASVNVETSMNQAGDELQITVSGNIAENILPEGEEMYTSVYVMEDGVKSTAQDWSDDAQKLAYGGVMVHQGIIRQRPTSVYGDKLIAAGDYSTTYTVDIDPEEWNTENMRVVALLHRRPNNKLFERQVINSGEVSLSTASIHEVAADGTMVTVTVTDSRAIEVNGSTEGVSVYTIGGKSVANANLVPGIYVISTNSIKTKVIVK